MAEGGEEWLPVILTGTLFGFCGAAEAGEILDVVGIGEALFGHAEEEGLGADFEEKMMFFFFKVLDGRGELDGSLDVVAPVLSPIVFPRVGRGDVERDEFACEAGEEGYGGRVVGDGVGDRTKIFEDWFH